MNQKQFYKWLGITPQVVKGDGHPFKTFKNKQEANDYLVARGIVSKEEMKKREDKARLSQSQLAYLADNQIPY